MGAVPGPGLLGFLSRQPFAALGALSLLSLAQDLLQLHSIIDGWTDAWRAVTHPLWDLLLGGILERFSLVLAPWLKDYFGVGLVILGMNLRSRLFEVRANPQETMVVWCLGPFPIFQFQRRNRFMHALSSALDLAEALLLWPGIIVGRFYRAAVGGQLAKQKMLVFVETFVWVVIALSVSHALVQFAM